MYKKSLPKTAYFFLPVAIVLVCHFNSKPRVSTIFHIKIVNSWDGTFKAEEVSCFKVREMQIAFAPAKKPQNITKSFWVCNVDWSLEQITRKTGWLLQGWLQLKLWSFSWGLRSQLFHRGLWFFGVVIKQAEERHCKELSSLSCIAVYSHLYNQ